MTHLRRRERTEHHRSSSSIGGLCVGGCEKNGRVKKEAYRDQRFRSTCRFSRGGSSSRWSADGCKRLLGGCLLESQRFACSKQSNRLLQTPGLCFLALGGFDPADISSPM